MIIMNTKPLLAEETLEKLLTAYRFDSVLDVGCGTGRHSRLFQQAGKQVTAIDIYPGLEGAVQADYLRHEFAAPFDCVWVSHVLEHQLNVNQFLTKVFRDLKEGGILALTIPPLKHEIVGGHVTLWNAGLLLYNLILAGFDCSQAAIKCYGYNISVIMPKTRPFMAMVRRRNESPQPRSFSISLSSTPVAMRKNMMNECAITRINVLIMAIKKWCPTVTLVPT